MTKSTPGPPAARQFGAAMLATLAVLFLIIVCPFSSLVVWGVWGWLTFCCGVLATAFFVVRGRSRNTRRIHLGCELCVFCRRGRRLLVAGRGSLRW